MCVCVLSVCGAVCGGAVCVAVCVAVCGCVPERGCVWLCVAVCPSVHALGFAHGHHRVRCDTRHAVTADGLRVRRPASVRIGQPSSGRPEPRRVTAPGACRVLHALFHPLSDDHVVVLSSDYRLRVFDLRKSNMPNSGGSRPSTTQTHRLVRPVPDLQVMEVALGVTAMHGEPVTFCFGANRGFERFTVVIATTTGALYLLCPVVPTGCSLPRAEWTSLRDRVAGELASAKATVRALSGEVAASSAATPVGSSSSGGGATGTVFEFRDAALRRGAPAAAVEAVMRDVQRLSRQLRWLNVGWVDESGADAGTGSGNGTGTGTGTGTQASTPRRTLPRRRLFSRRRSSRTTTPSSRSSLPPPSAQASARDGWVVCRENWHGAMFGADAATTEDGLVFSSLAPGLQGPLRILPSPPARRQAKAPVGGGDGSGAEATTLCSVVSLPASACGLPVVARLFSNGQLDVVTTLSPIRPEWATTTPDAVTTRLAVVDRGEGGGEGGGDGGGGSLGSAEASMWLLLASIDLELDGLKPRHKRSGRGGVKSLGDSHVVLPSLTVDDTAGHTLYCAHPHGAYVGTVDCEHMAVLCSLCVCVYGCVSCVLCLRVFVVVRITVMPSRCRGYTSSHTRHPPTSPHPRAVTQLRCVPLWPPLCLSTLRCDPVHWLEPANRHRCDCARG